MVYLQLDLHFPSDLLISPVGAEVWDISTLPLKPLCSIPDSAPSALARHWGETSQPVAGGGLPVVIAEVNGLQ